MTLKARLSKIESIKPSPEAQEPDRIYLCALEDNGGSSEPLVALLASGSRMWSISRNQDETLEAFENRADSEIASSSMPTEETGVEVQGSQQ